MTWEQNPCLGVGVAPRRLYLTLIASVLFSGCTPTPTVPQRVAYRCPPVDAYAQKWTGGFVQREETARAIAEAVVQETNGHESLKNRLPVRLIDQESQWLIVLGLKPGVFGGDTTFRINKCTAEITGLRFEE